MAFSQ
jgi:hypothetical protein